MRLPIRESQFDGATTLAVDRFGLGCLHPLLQSLDQFFVFLATHRSGTRSTADTTGLQGTLRTVRWVGLVDLDREVVPIGLLFRRPFSIRQRLAFRTAVARNRWIVGKPILGDLGLLFPFARFASVNVFSFHGAYTITSFCSHAARSSPLG